MEALASRELPIPRHFDIFHLQNEVEPSDKTALECVMEVDEERRLLEEEADELASRSDDEMAHDRYFQLYDLLLIFFYSLTVIVLSKGP